MYEDIACVNAIDADTSSGCFLDFPDVQVPAVMFSCQDIKDDPPAESTNDWVSNVSSYDDIQAIRYVDKLGTRKDE
ncbi:hypothetical protein OEA41_003413 [Lepraria neglecta]|uniref:Uncharacterized protein n=1 Tax=Lepraria neglecta TaxID=209136 RepID=A0AAD9Z487_9LECA|nr:hypothetical protein OEA41_003413 [Lepraria neglecta]